MRAWKIVLDHSFDTPRSMRESTCYNNLISEIPRRGLPRLGVVVGLAGSQRSGHGRQVDLLYEPATPGAALATDAVVLQRRTRDMDLGDLVGHEIDPITTLLG